MILTLKNIKSIKQNTHSELENEVCDYIIENWNDYDNKKSIFTDVLNYGCQSGVVGSLIYYSDTNAFYEKHKEEINELLYNLMNECGIYSPKDLFRDKWDEQDPLCTDCSNKNLLAWFGFEETLRNIGYKFTELQNCI